MLPVLVHQGPGGWRLSCEFAELFGIVPEPWRLYLPSFRHVLVDLTRIDDRELSGHALLRAFLKTLKYCRRRDLPDRLLWVLAEAPLLEDEDLVLILTYLDKGPVVVASEVMHEALARLVPERKERIMGSWSQPYYDKGKAEVRREYWPASSRSVSEYSRGRFDSAFLLRM